jgi:hypothetical protein
MFLTCVKTWLPSCAYILASLALASACGSKPSPPGQLENVGGSSGREPDASMSGGTGGAEPMLDAGLPEADAADAGELDAGELDAGADARAPQNDAAAAAEEGCVIGTLESRCGEGACPDLDEAADWLLAEEPSAVVRRRCEAADGTQFITIGGSFDSASNGYIYAAESGELVSTYVLSDIAEWCSETTPSSVGFNGRVIPDCAAVNPDDVTASCDDTSGPGNSGSSPEECIYTNG